MLDKKRQDVSIHLKADKTKIDVVKIYVSRHYLMSLQFYLYGKNPFLTIQMTKQGMIPKVLLSKYTKKIMNG